MELITRRTESVLINDVIALCMLHNKMICEEYKRSAACSLRGRDGSVDVATRYGLDSPGREPRWGRDSPYTCRPSPVQWVPGLKRLARGVDQPPPSSSGVEYR